MIYYDNDIEYAWDDFFIEEYPDCCAFTTMTGFPLADDEDENWPRKDLQKLIRDCEKHIREAIRDFSNHLVIVFNQDQYKYFGYSVEKLGFDLVSVSTNPNTNKLIYMYIRYVNIKRKRDVEEVGPAPKPDIYPQIRRRRPVKKGTFSVD